MTELATGAPLEGVTVTVIGPTRLTATTDASGSYVVSEVTVSRSSTILFEKTGYLRSIGSASIPSSAGNAPLSGGYATVNPQMAKAIGEVRGLLVLPDGTPAAGAPVTIDQRNQGYDSVVTTTTDMQGNFTLSGLAASPYGQYFDIIASWATSVAAEHIEPIELTYSQLPVHDAVLHVTGTGTGSGVNHGVPYLFARTAATSPSPKARR